MSTATGEVKAGRAYVEILLDQTKLERGLKQAQQKIKSFGSALMGIGKNMLAVSGVLAAPMVKKHNQECLKLLCSAIAEC